MRADRVGVDGEQSSRDSFRRDVVEGLRQKPKRLPCKYFYDDRGSRLFDQICELDEYYLTRTELAIMRQHAGEMARELGPDCLLIEYGSGSSIKTRMLLDHSPRLTAYIPVDIACEHLERTARTLATRYPRLEVLPVCADFVKPFELPRPSRSVRRRAVYFPGSTIGNFEPNRALELLENIGRVCGEGGGLLVGIDLQKDPRILEAAYDDSHGVTAEFNRNILRRINEQLGGDFRLDQFQHRAFYNRRAARVEMHLVSRSKQAARIGRERFEFDEGETICTEYSHKYTPDGFASMAAEAGFQLARCWTDPEELFAVEFLTQRAAGGR